MAFKWLHGYFIFIRMPFGLRNVPGTFQRCMDEILPPVQWPIALVYLEDIAVFSSSPYLNISQVKIVLTLLNLKRPAVNLKTCYFFSDMIDYLRHIIRPARLENCSHMTGKINGMQKLMNETELNYFFGLCNVYQLFVSSFGTLVAPMNKNLPEAEPQTSSELPTDDTNAIKT